MQYWQKLYLRFYEIVKTRCFIDFSAHHVKSSGRKKKSMKSCIFDDLLLQPRVFIGQAVVAWTVEIITLDCKDTTWPLDILTQYLEQHNIPCIQISVTFLNNLTGLILVHSHTINTMGPGNS